MAKLNKESQRLTEESNLRKCGICQEPIEEGELTWYEGMPAHEDCAWEEGQTL